MAASIDSLGSLFTQISTPMIALLVCLEASCAIAICHACTLLYFDASVTTSDTKQRVRSIRSKALVKLFGAVFALFAQSSHALQEVTVLMFEYHSIGFWANTTLQATNKWLERLGYACYLEGRPHLFKLAAGCWDNAFEVHHWSNVVSMRSRCCLDISNALSSGAVVE
jgi:hypothetical protein